MPRCSIPSFSSGPCAKPSSWDPTSYVNSEVVGRSHRSKKGLARIQELLARIRKILYIPENYYIGLVPASATGAMECLLWSLLGQRPVDVVNSCLFSARWASDITKELKIANVRSIISKRWEINGLHDVDFSKDVVFCWTGTTSGISVNNANWIPDDRCGLTICDATSVVFCEKIDWSKLDAVAFSWQKGLGGEGGLGVIILGPRAIERLQQYVPDRPIPRIYRLATDGNVNFNLFNGEITNTPSMICIEDCHACLDYAEQCGGLDGLIQKVGHNYQMMKIWEESQEIFKFCVKDESVRARHVLCFDINHAEYKNMSDAEKWIVIKKIEDVIEQKKVGCDIVGHVATVPHIRIWCGPTVITDNLLKLTKTLDEIVVDLFK